MDTNSTARLYRDWCRAGDDSSCSWRERVEAAGYNGRSNHDRARAARNVGLAGHSAGHRAAQYRALCNRRADRGCRMGTQVLSSIRPGGSGWGEDRVFTMAAPYRLGPQHRPVDHTGRRYGQLSVLGLAFREPKARGFHYYWTCQCDCGKKTFVRSSHLVSGQVQSCGCLRSKFDGLSVTHRYEYSSWANMIGRCENPSHVKYRYYGGRGIKVCQRWHDFALFIADMGRRPEGTTLDRKDPNGDYEPGNCSWVDHTTQRHSRRDYIAKHGKEVRC